MISVRGWYLCLSWSVRTWMKITKWAFPYNLLAWREWSDIQNTAVLRFVKVISIKKHYILTLKVLSLQSLSNTNIRIATWKKMQILLIEKILKLNHDFWFVWLLGSDVLCICGIMEYNTVNNCIKSWFFRLICIPNYKGSTVDNGSYFNKYWRLI